MIGQVATARVMVIEGQTMPDASVRLHLGKTTKLGHSDGSGHYQFKVSEPSGTYLVKIKARNHAGQVSKASMTVTKGDAVIAWIDTMIQVIKADIANVGLASRTLAMVSGAVYDAVNDIDRTGSVYKVDVQAPGGVRFGRGVRGGLHGAVGLDPSMEPLLEVRMAQSLAAVPSASASAAGVQVGREVAQGILAWRANDGSAATVPYVPARLPASGGPRRRLTRSPGGPSGARSRHSRSRNRRPPSSRRHLPP